MVHLFTYLILWYWTHLKLSIRGVHLLCCFFSFCHFQYDVRVGLIYYLFPEHIWLATLSRRNKDLLEPQFPWRFGRILVVPGGESCACRFFFSQKLCVSCIVSRLFSFFFNCLLLVFFPHFVDDMNKEQVILDIQSMAFFQQNPRVFHSLEPNLLTFNIFP